MTAAMHTWMHAMRLYLINPSNPLVSIVNVKESRWNRYRVWKPLSLMVRAGLTPPEWEISISGETSPWVGTVQLLRDWRRSCKLRL
jgi:hypothetical protein